MKTPGGISLYCLLLLIHLCQKTKESLHSSTNTFGIFCKLLTCWVSSSIASDILVVDKRLIVMGLGGGSNVLNCFHLSLCHCHRKCKILLIVAEVSPSHYMKKLLLMALINLNVVEEHAHWCKYFIDSFLWTDCGTQQCI